MTLFGLSCRYGATFATRGEASKRREILFIRQAGISIPPEGMTSVAEIADRIAEVTSALRGGCLHSVSR